MTGDAPGQTKRRRANNGFDAIRIQVPARNVIDHVRRGSTGEKVEMAAIALQIWKGHRERPQLPPLTCHEVVDV